MIALVLRLLRFAQLVGGVVVFLLGVSLALYFRLSGCCPSGEFQLWAAVISVLIVIFPGLMVTCGSFLQTVKYIQLGVLIVGLGAFSAVFFLAVPIVSLFVYNAGEWGQVAGVSYFILILVTVVLGIINAIVQRRTLEWE